MANAYFMVISLPTLKMSRLWPLILIIIKTYNRSCLEATGT
uniref:Uncharacterized protein n=1 Tax=Anguilla anguilla TaxID=7936 RepID=A0A0E9T8F5_ANGAN